MLNPTQIRSEPNPDPVIFFFWMRLLARTEALPVPWGRVEPIYASSAPGEAAFGMSIFLVDFFWSNFFGRFFFERHLASTEALPAT
jgi:hypothetical protein